jgi:hypothetical protein
MINKAKVDLTYPLQIKHPTAREDRFNLLSKYNISEKGKLRYSSFTKQKCR